MILSSLTMSNGHWIAGLVVFLLLVFLVLGIIKGCKMLKHTWQTTAGKKRALIMILTAIAITITLLLSIKIGRNISGEMGKEANRTISERNRSTMTFNN